MNTDLQNSPRKVRFLPYGILFVLTINWRLVPFDAAARVPAFLLGIFFLLHFSLMAKREYKLLWVWGIWATYTIVNTWCIGINFAGYKHGISDLFIRLFIPFAILALTQWLYSVDSRRTITWVMIVLGIRGLYFVISGAYTSFDFNTRWENEAGININEVGLSLVVWGWAILLWQQDKGKQKIVAIVALLFVGLAATQSGSRSSFISFVILIVVSVLPKCDFKKLRTYVSLPLLALIGIYFYSFVIEDTALGARLINTQHEMERFYFGDTVLARLLGDRAVYYFEGSRIFIDFPWFGVGYGNFVLHNSFGPYVCHVELMLQLAEGGIIGSALFLLFYGGLGTKLLSRFLKSTQRAKDSIYIAGFILVMAINFTSYTSTRPVYFLILGLCLGYATSTEQENRD